MYELRVVLRKNAKWFGYCHWKRRTILLNPARIWDSWITRHPDPEMRAWPQGNKELLFTIVLRETIFHEYMHEFLFEERIRPWRCNRCREGKCKLCLLSARLLEYI